MHVACVVIARLAAAEPAKPHDEVFSSVGVGEPVVAMFHVPKTGGLTFWDVVREYLPYHFPDHGDSNTYPGCRPFHERSKEEPWNAVLRSLHSVPTEIAACLQSGRANLHSGGQKVL